MIKVKAHKRKGRNVKAHIRKSKSKIKKVMHEWKTGTLHSGSKHGKKVTDQRQAIAIAISEQKKKDKQKRK